MGQSEEWPHKRNIAEDGGGPVSHSKELGLCPQCEKTRDHSHILHGIYLAGWVVANGSRKRL